MTFGTTKTRCSITPPMLRCCQRMAARVEGRWWSLGVRCCGWKWIAASARQCSVHPAREAAPRRMTHQMMAKASGRGFALTATPFPNICLWPGIPRLFFPPMLMNNSERESVPYLVGSELPPSIREAGRNESRRCILHCPFIRPPVRIRSTVASSMATMPPARSTVCKGLI